MALAATLASNGPRTASFLPAVKCSDCGQEIEISNMGGHICPSPAQIMPSSRGHSPHMSNPFTLRRMDNHAAQQSSIAAPSPLQHAQYPPYPPIQRPLHPAAQYPSQPPHPAAQHSSHLAAPVPRQLKPVLPKINPNAANTPYLAPQQSSLLPPPSPAISARSGSSQGGKPGFTRSMTSPMPRLYDPRPPSTELSANLDCAFPPWPTTPSSDRRPSTSQGRKTPTGSERAPSRAASRLDHVVSADPESFGPDIRGLAGRGNENVLQKMNAMKSGPFDGTRRKGSADSKQSPASPSKSLPSGSQEEDLPCRSSTTSSNYSLPRRPSIPKFPEDLEKKWSPSQPTQSAEGEPSPRFLNQFSAEPDDLASSPPYLTGAAVGDRSHTFPLPEVNGTTSTTQVISKMRNESTVQGLEQKQPSLSAAVQSDSSAILQDQPPPRTDSRNGTRHDFRMQNAPPVPKAVQQYRQNSAHSPSDSGSSIFSGTNSTQNTTSTGPSPAGSVASSVDAFSPLSYEPGTYAEDDKMRVRGLNINSQQSSGMRTEERTPMSPPRNFARPGAPRETVQEANAIPPPLESPMDPALLQMQNPSPPTYKPWQPAAATSPPNQKRPMPVRMQTTPGQVPRTNLPFSPPVSIPEVPNLDDSMNRNTPISRVRSPSAAGSQYGVGPRTTSLSARSPRPPPVPQNSQPKRELTRRGTNAKPICRGCGLAIEGKSVKAADGRLTGRWHKSCFVCRSCQQPFETADFYVINNEPYCEHDYHEQNGSLCHGCHRGIEGQYLETSSTNNGRFRGSREKKYHPRCFTCFECRMVLAQDYFELGGKVFCERHALAAMRAQARIGAGGGPGGAGLGLPPGTRAERRTTRLMNMVA